MKYIQPEVYRRSYTCPLCGVLAKQSWDHRSWTFTKQTTKIDNQIRVGRCDHCSNFTLWLNEKMLAPNTGNAPFPNTDMPESVNKLYLEAASIAQNSPRGAAAILRLAIQVLCKELGGKGDNINNDIKELVKKGLPELVQQSLDVVRVTGNDAVHPGQINTDDIEEVNQLFGLINVIIEYMVSLPNKVSGLYTGLPADKLKGITDRDSDK